MDNNFNINLEENENHKYNLCDSPICNENSNCSSKSFSSEKINYNEENTKNTSLIKEVYADNLIEELKIISLLLDEYNYIGMDTEFPGTLYTLENIDDDFYYKNMEKNVNSLKLIQLGITLTNKKGEYPKDIPYHTWQFNFKFDEKNDLYSKDSLKLLKDSGINFEILKKNGIEHKKFAENLIVSGLVLNPNVRWISYQGSFDFAYLLKLLINENLPKIENEFITSLGIYFPKYYDLRILIKDIDNYFYGGLNKLIETLSIKRKGIKHQAGSDSIATIEAFHKLRENGSINKEKIKKLKNILYGIGIGRDNENTIRYLNHNNNININNIYYINTINSNNFNNNILNSNNYYNKNNQINYCVNNNRWYYPYFNIYTYGMDEKNLLLHQMKISQKKIA